MCGIVACRRTGDALDYLIPSLRRLDYRGYDSAGVAVVRPDRRGLAEMRAVGRVENLAGALRDSEQFTGRLGIGHTRWATHGEVSESNAHPHGDCAGEVSVVHNGIIENADELRAALRQRGHRFTSTVDSEVVPHLVEEARSAGLSLVAAVQHAVGHLDGSWALAVVAHDCDELVLTCHRSPLVVASGDDGFYAASDVTALLGWADSVQVLEDGDVVVVGDAVRWQNADGEDRAGPAPVAATWSIEDAEVGTFSDFMEKEISEQPSVAAKLLDRVLPGVADGSWWREMGGPDFRRVRLVGCGTSLNAASVIRDAFRSFGVPASVAIASECQGEIVEPETLTIALSQSGETADVLSALEGVGGFVCAITNSVHSTLARRADAVVDCGAGPEIGVAATKTFTAQVLVGGALALASSLGSGHVDRSQASAAIAQLGEVPRLLELAEWVSGPIAGALAAELVNEEGFLFVSRGLGSPYAQEGALKLKELTYRWAESYPAGELKHGPIALLEVGTPVIVVDGGPPGKLEANIAEMKARGARIIRIGSEGSSTFPVLTAGSRQLLGPVEAIPALQHLARSLALALGRDVDRPRNLAKSVTVE